MRHVLFALLWVFLPWQSFAKEVTYLESIAIQDNALIDRLTGILKVRLDLLKNCPDMSFIQNAKALTSSIDKADFEAPSFKAMQKRILNSLMTTLRDSKGVEQACKNRAPEIISTRKPFLFAQNSENDKNPLNRIWLKTLEPSCYKVRLRGTLNNVDQNACFAGDRLIDHSFKKLNATPVESSLDFSYALIASVDGLQEGGDVQIDEAFLASHGERNDAFLLTLMAAIGTSGPSGLTGWLQGFEDRMLIEDLNSDLSNQEIYKHYDKFQYAKFNYITFRDLITKHKMRLKLYDRDVSAWNRHNFMAAFLGCTNGAQFGARTPSLVYYTGVAYEAKDFLSHLKEGAGLTASRKNFNDDTERYKVSGQMGYELCNPNQNPDPAPADQAMRSNASTSSAQYL